MRGMKRSVLLAFTVIGLTGTLWSISARAENKDEVRIQNLLRSKAEAKNASKELKRRCKKGDGEACSVRGAIYEFGIGHMRKNRLTASNQYKKGCELDDPLGCTLLGLMYYYGDYLPKDSRKGRRLIKKGCKLGYDDACHILDRLDD